MYVYTEDKAVYNYVTFNVTDYVALEDFEFSYKANVVGVGESLAPDIAFTPADTTRKNIVYSSSDPSIIEVESKTGIVTGISSGIATITATCEGISHTYTLEAYVKATSLELESIALSLPLADGERALPQVITNEGAKTDLTWRSVDETVAKIENGKLVPISTGTTTLVVTDKNSGLSATSLVIVGEENLSLVKKFQKSKRHNFVLLEK